MQADVDAVSLRHGLSTPIRLFAHMPVPVPAETTPTSRPIRTTSARNAASARGDRQILPRHTNFIITNMARPAEKFVIFYNQGGMWPFCRHKQAIDFNVK
jgi:hypothetical protein